MQAGRWKETRIPTGLTYDANGNLTGTGSSTLSWNVCDMEAVLATMRQDVVWANGMEGGHVYGHDGVRNYWTGRWAMIDGHVEPAGFSAGADGTTDVDVHQTVRDLNGNVLSDKMVGHIFWDSGRPDQTLRYPLVSYREDSN